MSCPLHYLPQSSSCVMVLTCWPLSVQRCLHRDSRLFICPWSDRFTMVHYSRAPTRSPLEVWACVWLPTPTLRWQLWVGKLNLSCDVIAVKHLNERILNNDNLIRQLPKAIMPHDSRQSLTVPLRAFLWICIAHVEADELDAALKASQSRSMMCFLRTSWPKATGRDAFVRQPKPLLPLLPTELPEHLRLLKTTQESLGLILSLRRAISFVSDLWLMSCYDIYIYIYIYIHTHTLLLHSSSGLDARGSFFEKITHVVNHMI